jgi:predicted amidohydrolase YtcJ
MSAETVYHGGTVHTLDEARPTVQALAVKNGRVLAAGTLTEMRPHISPATRLHDLGGAVVVPGLNDAHVHVWKVGQLQTTSLDLRGLSSLDELYRRVRERAATLSPGGWLIGRGWNEALLGGPPTKAALDAASPQNPLLLTRTCAHIHALNSAALQLSGVDAATVSPAGGEIDFAAGLLYETAFGSALRAMPVATQGDLEAWILAGLHHLARQGLTSVTDPAVDAPLYAAYRALDAAGRLPIRVNLLYMRRPDGESATYPLPEMHHSAHLRCDSVKFFADGGLSGATAALSVPYRNVTPESKGFLRFEAEELYELALEAQTAGFRIGTHAIGDVALTQVLDVYRRLRAASAPGQPTIRHRIEHFGLPDARHLRLARELGVHAVPQAIFLHELRGNFERYLPPEYLGQTYNLRALLDAGLNVALSSDGPVVREVNPLVGLQAAVQEPMTPGGQITPHEALHAYTVGGALAQSDEANRGRLKPGYWADLTVLDADPLTHPEPGRIVVRQTVVGGRAVEHAAAVGLEG